MTFPSWCCQQCGAPVGWLGRILPFHACPPPPKPEKPPIEFRSDDDMYKRAENIWRAIGFANDRFGAIPQIAGYLSMYRDWDKHQGSKK